MFQVPEGPRDVPLHQPPPRLQGGLGTAAVKEERIEKNGETVQKKIPYRAQEES